MTGKKSAEGSNADEAENAPTETVPIEKLKASLEEIKEYEGVIGYILRNSTSATIDLKDPSKLIEYAILSASSLNAAEELSELFNLGTAKHITVEGKNVKALSIIFGENKVSLFLEKNADLEKILERLNSLKN
jgi:predicted regulator of Ras-like GTPase activity (Roadblock/LC7/MglB family)